MTQPRRHLYDTSETTGTPFWDTRNSGSIPQSLSHMDHSQVPTSYVRDTRLSPFECPTTNEKVAAEVFAGQISSSHCRFNFSGGNLMQSLPVIPRWAAAENILGLLPSDIPVHGGLTPLAQAQLEVSVKPLSFTAFGRLEDALDVPGRPYVSRYNDAHAVSAVDENSPAGPAVAQMHDHTNLQHFSQMPEQRTSVHFQEGKSTHMSFPTLGTFTPPVSGLPQWPAIHPSQCYSFHHTATVQTPANQTRPRSIGSFDGYSHPSAAMNLDVLGIGQTNDVYPTPASYQWQSAHSQTTVESAIHGYSDTTDYGAMHAMMVTGPVAQCLQDSYGTQSLIGNTVFEPFASIPYGPTVTPSKRKTGDDIRTVNISPSPPPTSTETRKRRRVKSAEIEMKKFGAYAVADANATAMPKPLVDHDPVDVSRRTVYDADGKLLRTRHYGVMEIDDSYGNRSATVSKELPEDLTCVRPCEWSDRPCGLYIEMCKDRISNHLFNWHRISANAKAPCNFQGCTDTSAMNNLGRHIETVHYATSWQCQYCRKLLSRSDAAARHRKTCEFFKHAEQQAAHTGHTIQSARKVLTGYIVPGRDYA